MCVATVAMFIGCGGQNKKADSTQKDEVDVEKVFETGAYGEGTKAAAQEAFKGIGLTLEQIEPEYKYLDDDTLKIFKGMVYKGLYEGLAVFIKADKADVSRVEFENYVRKIYDVTKKTADDGKVIYGFEKKSKADEANALSTCRGGAIFFHYLEKLLQYYTFVLDDPYTIARRFVIYI